MAGRGGSWRRRRRGGEHVPRCEREGARDNPRYNYHPLFAHVDWAGPTIKATRAHKTPRTIIIIIIK